MSAWLARLRRDEGGTTLVEFALVAPVLLLVLVVALDFARALNAYVTIANASREGARYASVYANVDPLATEARVREIVRAHVVPLDTSPLVLRITLTPYVRTGDTRWTTSSPAPGEVVVEVRYSWNAVTWLAGSFFSAAGSADFTVTSSMEMIR